MTAKNGHVIASGVISTLVLLSGITMCVLVYEFVRKAAEAVVEKLDEQESSSDVTDLAVRISGPFWLFGLVFIIPGLTGIIAAVMRGKGGFITHMVFTIISLVVMGILFICGVIVLGVLAAGGGTHCKVIGGSCQCRNDLGDYSDTGLKNCDVVTELYAIGVAIVVIIVLAWILELADSVITGILACSSECNTSGVIIRHMPPVVHMAPVVSMGSHDRAVLVQNAQY